ncbi:hypothetical protein NPIL_680561 [Nephila pilipes]|uniref:Uncharacterized protein n=1 Tax=Nephila pilipes TaxID=299642 RepID=A0A8X6NLQ2_NEPPI|nr:hypothetical protein NPIL_680561 [Nephila pilipes]
MRPASLSGIWVLRPRFVRRVARLLRDVCTDFYHELNCPFTKDPLSLLDSFLSYSLEVLANRALSKHPKPIPVGPTPTSIGSITVPDLALLQRYMARGVEGRSQNQISAAESEFSMHGHALTRKCQNSGDSVENIRYFLICNDQGVVTEAQ